MHPNITIEWHYNEAHQGKGPMDGIGGTLKNLVYRRVLSGDAVINTPPKFAEFSNQISSVNCLFLDKPEFIQEPEEVSTHANTVNIESSKFSRVRNGPHSFSNHFFKLSEDFEPFHIEKYGVQCGHSVSNINYESVSNNCYKRHILGEEWLKCPVCCLWYHEDCFYV